MKIGVIKPLSRLAWIAASNLFRTDSHPFRNKMRFSSYVFQGKMPALFVILIPFFFFPARADKAWIKPPQTPFLNFKAHIEALGSPHITYAKYQLSQRRKIAQTFKLIQHIQKAQELYLSGTLPSAKKAFQDIIQMAHAADWNEEDRRIILYAFLRSAQLEEQPDIQKALLLSASRFFRKRITPQQADYNLFPPPLTEKFNSLLKSQVFFTVNWKEIFPKHEIILVNGERVSVHKPLQTPAGVYRTTALSSSYAPWSRTFSLSRLISRPVHTKALTTGTCRSLKIAPKWENPSVQLLSPECPAPLKFAGGGVLSNKEDLLPAKEGTIQMNFPEKATNLSKKRKIPKWLWITGGIAAGSLLIYLQDFQSTQKPPPVFHY